MRSHAHTPQQGAASLIVVLVLFFMMMLVAAYASRSLVFEQKTSANQYRHTQAFEAAEAGLQWATAMLNGGPIDGACQPAVAGPFVTFRERYLTADASNGRFSAVPNAAPITVAGLSDPRVQPGCIKSAGGWTCSCPPSGQANLAAPAGPGAFPAFTVEVTGVAQPGMVSVRSRGCSSLGGRCLHGSALTSDAFVQMTTLLALTHALRTPPTAALTARLGVDVGMAAVGFSNPDATSGGVTVDAGGAIVAGGARLSTVAGSSPSASLIDNDASLSATTPDRMFIGVFGMDKASFQRLPGVKQVTCGGECTAALQNAYDNDRARMVRVTDDLVLGSNATIGTPTDPLIVVVAGNVRIGGTTRFNGLVYSTAASWDNGDGGTALVRGAAVAEGTFTAAGTPDFHYDADVLARLHLLVGAFTRVPGSWNDIR